MTSRRNTIQKDLVRNAVYEMRRHVTANEVYEFIKEAYPTIGKGTVYRNLDILVEEGALRKVEVPNGPNRFDFTLKNHYHVKCIKCGEIFDVDMDQIPDLLERIHNTHGIEFVDYDISFKGICPKCREKVKEENMDRKALYKLSYGLFVLTAREDGKDNGCIINTAIQAASEPNQLSICVNKANYTHDMIQRTGKFTVSVLSQKAQFKLFKHFGFQSGRDTNKFEAFEQCARGTNGIYYITEGTKAYISVTVTKTEDLGSHTMFIGEITDMEVLSNVPSVAYAYKMKYDAIKKKAGRKNCGQVDHNTGKRSSDVIGELCGDSAKQVQRYIKMTELIPALLDKVDDGSMGFTPAVQLSYLKKKEQQEIIDAMEATQCTPSLSQAIRIKKLSEAGKLTESEAEGILGEIKQKEADRVVFKNEQLYRFFPSTYTSEQMRREILEILKSWRNSNWI